MSVSLHHCPPADDLRAYLADEVATDRYAPLEAHVEGCRPCQAELARLSFGPEFPAATPPPSDRLLELLATPPINFAPPAPAITLPGYEVVRELGRGGSGVVYLARDLTLGREVAVKVLLHGAHARPDDLVRFHTEARAVAGLGHPDVVQLFHVGETNGLPFCVMEYAPGGSLRQCVASGPLLPREAAGLVERVARAVHAVHEVGYVHRDLKPENVLLAADGAPKVADFGLALRLAPGSGEAGPGPTRTGAAVGTPGYMAPEQVAGQRSRVGPATDVYALGATLYELLTGRPPFAGPDAVTLSHILTREPAAPRRLNPAVPRDLETVCLKCLSKDPAGRYPVALDLADDLRRFLDGRQVLARPVGALARALRWARRNPRLALLLGAVVGLLVVLAVSGPVMAYQQARLVDDLGQANAQLESMNGSLEQANDRERHAAQEARGSSEEARRAAEEAKEKANLSRHAAGEMLNLVVNTYSNADKSDAAQLRTLQTVVRVYSRTEEADPPFGSAYNFAKSHLYLSHYQCQVGDAAAGVTAARTGVERFRALAEKTGKPMCRWWEARAEVQCGRALDKVGRPADAQAACSSALSTMNSLPLEIDGIGHEAWYAWLVEMNEYSLLLVRWRRFREAEPFIQEVLRVAAGRPGDPPSEGRREALALAESDLAAVLVETGRRDEAGTVGRQALALLEALMAEFPRQHDYKWDVAKATHRLALCKSDRPAESLPLLQGALTRYAAAQAKKPPGAAQRYNEALCRFDIGDALSRLGRLPEAETEFRAASRVFDDLRSDPDAAPSDEVCLARSVGRLAALRADTAGPEAGVAELSPAIAALEAALRKYTQCPPALPRALTETCRQQAGYLSALGRHTQAAAMLAQAATCPQADRPTLQAQQAAALARAGDPGSALPLADAVGREIALTADAALDLARAYALSIRGAPDARRANIAAKAVALLGRALRDGAFASPAAVERLRTDPDLAALQDRAEMKPFLDALGVNGRRNTK